MTGLQRAKRIVKVGPREVSHATNMVERKTRRKVKRNLHVGEYDRISPRIPTVEYYVS